MSSTPKLIDLSVALRFEDARRSTSPVGTDAYMAPEQCDPARFAQIGPASDSWGLGVTLYEALAAERPFPAGDPEAESLQARYPQVANEPEPLGEDVLPPLREIVLACLMRTVSPRPHGRLMGPGYSWS